MSEVKDQNVSVEGKTIGFASVVKLNIKTVLWILGFLYMVLGYLYIDQRKRLNEATSILNTEKQEFLRGVEGTINDDIDDVKNDVSDIRVDMATIRGDIRLILDRQTRENPETERRDVNVQPVIPPDIDSSE